ncbi:MAG: hypothetical protein KAT32_05135 [Candidatus Moranbacteria bacterium]|nr:hypothetical protein [Candidatus Moranbacteria bacterium]
MLIIFLVSCFAFYLIIFKYDCIGDDIDYDYCERIGYEGVKNINLTQNFIGNLFILIVFYISPIIFITSFLLFKQDYKNRKLKYFFKKYYFYSLITSGILSMFSFYVILFLL